MSRGIWIDMLCVMHTCNPYGFFTFNGSVPDDVTASRVLGCTLEEYQNAVTELEKYHVLSRDSHGIIYNRRMVRDAKERQAWRERKQKQRKHVPRNVTPKSRNSHTVSSSSLKEKDNILSSNLDSIPFSEIINYLNQITKKKFSLSTKSTKQHIRARWNEGRRLNDFKRVVDIKFEKWGSDPKMVDYLRPETLFGTKMESYLNESVPEDPYEELRHGKENRTVGSMGSNS